MPPARAWRRLAAVIPLSLVLAVSGAGCATVQGPPDPQDPWEGFNRSMFELNQTLDKALIRPVAELYQKVTPDPVDSGPGPSQPPRNSVVSSEDTTTMPMYSPTKNIAHFMPAYSVW